MQWININDQMPAQGITCLLYQTYPPGKMFNCRQDPLERTNITLGGLRYDGKFISYDDQFSGVFLKHVSHWMSLPSRPTDNVIKNERKNSPLA